LTQTVFYMSPENPFIFVGQKIKGQGHEAQKVPTWVFALL